MASYTSDQLAGAGSPMEAITGNSTFTLSNPNAYPAYFTVETVRGAGGFYSGSVPTNAIGSYSNFTNIDEGTLITSSYISSVAVPSGTTSYQFNPTTNIAVSSSVVRATGGITLTIS